MLAEQSCKRIGYLLFFFHKQLKICLCSVSDSTFNNIWREPDIHVLAACRVAQPLRWWGFFDSHTRPICQRLHLNYKFCLLLSLKYSWNYSLIHSFGMCYWKFYAIFVFVFFFQFLKMKNHHLTSLRGTLEFVLCHKSHPLDENKEFGLIGWAIPLEWLSEADSN